MNGGWSSVKSDKQLTDECFNAYVAARPEFQKTFGNKDLALLNSQIAAHAQAAIEFAWVQFKEEQIMDGQVEKDTTVIDINTDNTYIIIPKGDKLIKYKKVE